jgi:hypothetical protein
MASLETLDSARDQWHVVPAEPSTPRPSRDTRAISLTSAERASARVPNLQFCLVIGGIVFFVTFGLIGPSLSTKPALIAAGIAALCAMVIVAYVQNYVRIARLERANYDRAVAAFEADLKRCASDAELLSSVLRTNYEQSVELDASAREHLKWASGWLHNAEHEYAASAFAPFWDAVEQAALNLASCDEKVRRLITNAETYHAKLYERRHTFPRFPVDANDLAPVSSGVAANFNRVVRLGQTNFHFANIWEHRATRNVMIAGFQTLGETMRGIAGTISYSVSGLQQSMSTDLARVVQEEIRSRDTLDLRLREQNRMLDNIQHQREPRPGDTPAR